MHSARLQSQWVTCQPWSPQKRRSNHRLRSYFSPVTFTVTVVVTMPTLLRSVTLYFPACFALSAFSMCRVVELWELSIWTPFTRESLSLHSTSGIGRAVNLRVTRLFSPSSSASVRSWVLNAGEAKENISTLKHSRDQREVREVNGSKEFQSYLVFCTLYSDFDGFLVPAMLIGDIDCVVALIFAIHILDDERGESIAPHRHLVFPSVVDLPAILPPDDVRLWFAKYQRGEFGVTACFGIDWL